MPSSTASSARYDVRILDAGDWAATVGAAWAGLLGGRPDLRMCLATGRTPLPVYADLVAAERVWVLVTGSSKADTVRACLEEPPAASRPASALQGHPRCTWWLDEAAASRLTAQTT